MNKKVTVAIAGLGSRGLDCYAQVAKLLPEKMEITAVADIRPERVEEAKRQFGISAERCYTSAEEMLQQPRLAEVMFICTQDRQHVGHGVPALKKGYHLLLEKPVSPDLEECREIVRVAHECNRHVVVCHVLRYTPFYSKLKEIVDSGVIGDIVSIQAIENVGYWHQAHSFVRGNWSNSDKSSPMILQKCCHDMDILLWLTGKRCKSVSSYGSNHLFRPEMAPEGAALRCLDGCKAKEGCPFDAKKIYLDDPQIGVRNGRTGWPANVVATNPTEQSITEALKTGPYGRCVYHCDNNVVDHQVVNLLLEDGATVNFTMCGFTSKGHRFTKIMGTKGDIEANMGTNIIDVGVFGKPHELIDVSKLAKDFSGHGGGDNRMVEELLDLVAGGKPAGTALTSIDHSLESHYVALAAEKSRLENGKVIEISDIR